MRVFCILSLVLGVMLVPDRGQAQTAVSVWDISVRYGIGPEVYYVPVAIAPGPPYGKAYGHYKKPRKDWKSIVLSDDDLVIHTEMSGRRPGRDRDDDDRSSKGPGKGRRGR